MAQHIQLNITKAGGTRSTFVARSGTANVVRETAVTRIEFLDPVTGKAPTKVKARWAGQDLVLEFDLSGEAVTVVLENYDEHRGELVGLDTAGDRGLAYVGPDGATFSSLADGAAASFELPGAAGVGATDGAVRVAAGVIGAVTTAALLRRVSDHGEAGVEDVDNVIVGTPREDTLTGTERRDRIFARESDDAAHGGGGDDTVLGEDGNDTIEGGLGNDVLIAGADTTDHGAAGTVNGAADWLSYQNASSGVTVDLFGNGRFGTVTGGDGGDTIYGFENVLGSSGADSVMVSTSTPHDGVISTGDGNDTITYAASLTGHTTVIGGAGDDHLALGNTHDLIVDGDGNDTYIAGGGLDTIDFSDNTIAMTNASLGDGRYERLAGTERDVYGGADVLVLGSGNDHWTQYDDGLATTLFTGAGDDRVELEGGGVVDMGTGQDTVRWGSSTVSGATLHGGRGTDWLQADGATPVTVDMLNGGSMSGGIVFDDFENVITGAGDDSITGDDNDNHLIAGAGDDTLEGGAGANHLQGGDGNDVLILQSSQDTIDGGDGVDWLLAASAVNGATVDLASGSARHSLWAPGDSVRLVGIENLMTGAGDDSIVGDGNANQLIAGAGDDTVEGGLGADVLIAGVSTADHGSLASLNGSADWLSYQNAAGGVTVDLAGDGTRGTVIGADGADTVYGFENAITGVGDDSIKGDANGNHLIAGAGDDTIVGGAGNDTIEGGLGNDVLIAGTSTADHDDVGSVNGSADWLSYQNATSGVTVDLLGEGSFGTAVGGDGIDTLYGFENVMGTRHDDSVFISTYADLIASLGNLDNLNELPLFFGSSYSGVIDTGDGNDTITYLTTSGNTTVITGSGDDVLLQREQIVYISTSNDTVDVGTGNDYAALARGNDAFLMNAAYLADTGVDTIVGGMGYDGIVLQGSGLNLNLMSTNFGAANLTGFEHIDLNGGGNRLSLSAVDLLELTGSPDPALSTLVIQGDATNTVDATGFDAVTGSGVAVSVDVDGDGGFGTSEQFVTNASGQITGDLGAGMQTYVVYQSASYGTLVVDADIQRTIA